MSTRDPLEALRERTAILEEELRTLDQKRRERVAIDGEVRRVEDELGKSRNLLDRLQQKRALPMLDAMKIASPCSASWDDMVGDDRTRYCGKCEKNVYNLSAMTREEAELTVLSKEGDLCVRLFQRTDGTVLTQDCPVGVRRKRLRLAGVLAIGSSIAGATVAMFAGAGDDLTYEEPTAPTAQTVPTVVETPVPTVDEGPVTNRPNGHWVAGGLRAPPPHVPPPTDPKVHPEPKVHKLMGKPSMPPPKEKKDLIDF